jgi:hypothetical protein
LHTTKKHVNQNYPKKYGKSKQKTKITNKQTFGGKNQTHLQVWLEEA